MQRFEEGFGRGLEAEAFPWCIVVARDELVDGVVGDLIEVGFAGQEAPEASDGVFDTAFLPGASGFAEVGLDAELAFEPVVLGELGAVVEGDGFAQRPGHGFEDVGQCPCGGCGLEACGSDDEGEA